jgi:glycosyltransferase involved in cell wall biosynthesis
LKKKSVCLLPKLQGPGGPSSFQAKLRQGLASHSIEAHHDPTRADCGTILVTGGTRQLPALWQARRRGVRIVQRLDGMNWLHRVRHTGLRHYLRSEGNNFLLATIRRHLADHIVYQSVFTHDWWQTRHRDVGATNEVIYNGVDLQVFSPDGSQARAENQIRVLVIEGSFRGGHERDLLNAVEFASGLQQKTGKPLELIIAGQVPNELKGGISGDSNFHINWIGLVPHGNIPDLDRSSHLFFPAEINAACPNSVVEALACGLPVIAYATGSLPELVDGDAGRVAPYSSDYWHLEAPDQTAIIDCAMKILANQPHFRQAARERAEEHFGLEQMTEKYIQALNL